MRFMAQARHTGKIVLSLDGPDVMLRHKGSDTALQTGRDRTSITGGLGGFGLAAAERLVRGGAPVLWLSSAASTVWRRSSAARSRSPGEAGARIEVLQADVSIARTTSARILGRVRSGMPPLRGVVHAAMVLDDGRLDQMEWSQFERVLGAEDGGRLEPAHADRGRTPRPLRDVLVDRGAARQSPSGQLRRGERYLDALAHSSSRPAAFPALSIAWGVLSGVGYVADRHDLSEYLAASGLSRVLARAGARRARTRARAAPHDHDGGAP